MSRPRRLSLNPAHLPNGATPDPTPPPTPELFSPESTVSRVLTRLHAQHPTLAAPTVAETHSFLEKAAQVPALPEWIWYGMLHFAVEQDDDGGERETVDFGILDEVLDADIVERGRGGRVLDMLFFYMYLCLEPSRAHEEGKEYGGNKEEREEPAQEEEVAAVAALVVGREELERRTEELKAEGVVTPPATEDGSGSEGERTVRRRKGKGSVSQKSEEQQELQTHHQEQQEHRDQQKSAGGLDIKSIIILFLLITIGLLLVFPPSEDAFAHVRRLCEQTYFRAMATFWQTYTHATERLCEQPYFRAMATFSQTYTHAAEALAKTYGMHCQEGCQRVVDLVVDNVRYRLGTLELAGGGARPEL